MPYLDAGYEVIIGSRSVRGSKLNPPQNIFKQIAGKLGNLFIQLILLRGIWDTQCGFKCFSEEATQRIFPLLKINRWGFDIEALALARKIGYKIKEMPVHWVNDRRSHVSIKSYFQVLWEAIKVRWWLWRGVYKI